MFRASTLMGTIIMKLIIIMLVVRVCICTVVSVAEGDVKFDAQDVKSANDEILRISKLYGNDPKRMKEELQRVKDSIAAKVPESVRQIMKRRDELFIKYGHPSALAELVPSSGNAGLIVDHDAWVLEITETPEGLLRVTGTLDQLRYKGSKLQNVVIALRGSGTTREERLKITLGDDVPGVSMIPLEVIEIGSLVYRTEFRLAKLERAQYRIQVLATIEPGWRTVGTSELPSSK